MPEPVTAHVTQPAVQPATTAAEPAAPAQTAEPKTLTARERHEALKARREGRPTTHRPHQSVAAAVNNVPVPHHSTEQARNTQGQFVAPEPAAGSSPAVTPAPEPAVAPAPVDSTGRIQLPESDPLRARGKQFVDELAPHELKSFLKRHAPAVLAETETALQRAQRLEAELARERAASAVWKEQGGLGDPQNDPTYAELYAVDPAVAELYWKGVLADREGIVNKKLEAAEATTVQQQYEADGQRFLHEAYTDITGRLDSRIAYHPAFRAVFDEASQLYDALAERGMVPQASVEDFWARGIKPVLKYHPQLAPIIAAITAERDAARNSELAKQAAAAAEAKQKQELEALQATRRNNGHARLPAAANAGAVQAEGSRPKTPRQIREELNQRLRPTVRR